MRNILLKLVLLISVQLLSLSIFAQAPERINYQAVARNLSGVPLVSTPLASVIFEVRTTSGLPSSAVYREEHTTLSTNQFGLFTAEIGGGTPLSGNFSTIAWGSGSFYLYVEINGDPMGATQLLSVPYALYAKTASNGVDGVNSLINSTPDASGTCANGGYLIESGLDINGNNILDAGEVQVNYYICNGEDGAIGPQGPAGLDGTNGTTYFEGNGISLSGDTITNLGDNDNDSSNELQVLSISNDTLFLSNGNNVVLPSLSETITSIQDNGDGTYTYTDELGLQEVIDANIDDADADPNNELQTLSLNTAQDSLFITNGNGIQLPSVTGDDWGNDTVNVAGGNIMGSGTNLNPLMVIDNDTSATNEFQDLTNGGKVGNNQTININNGTGVTFSVADGDSLATNELQMLSLNTAQDSIFISNGNGIELPLSGSVFAVTDTITSNENGNYVTDSFVFGSPSLADDGDSNHESRFFFDKTKSAFRAGLFPPGYADTNVGMYSFAMGVASKAEGYGSSAIGVSSSAIGVGSFAVGQNANANNDNSVALGVSSTANADNAFAIGNVVNANGANSFVLGTVSTVNGANSFSLGNLNNLAGDNAIGIGYNITSSYPSNVAIGTNVEAHAYNAVVIGKNLRSYTYNEIVLGSQNTSVFGDTINWVPTDRLFVVGNGNGTPSDALVMLKNGNTTLKGTMTLTDGASSYTLPNIDGNALDVLTTDGSGNTYWGASGVATSPWTDGGTNIYSTTLSDNVSIGVTNTTNAKFQVDNSLEQFSGNFTQTSAATAFTQTIRATNNASGNFDKTAIYGASFGTGSDLVIGVNGSANGGNNNRGIEGLASGNTGQRTAVYGTVTGAGTGPTQGLAINNSSSNTGSSFAGTFSNTNSSSVNTYGVRSTINSTNTGVSYQYGVYSTNTSSSANATKYGYHATIGGTGSVHYGIYTEVNGASTNWSAYFADGDVYINDNLVLPNGAINNYVLKTDGSGNASWADISTLSPTGVWSKSGSFVFPTTLNDSIGIGTSTPSQILHVTNGQILNDWSNPNADPNLFINNYNSATGPSYNTGTLGQVTIATSDGAENKYAIQGHAGGDNGKKYGVVGSGTGVGTENYGGYFTASGATTNRGLTAWGTASTSTSYATGVYAVATGNTTQSTYGIYAQNASSGTGPSSAGFFINANTTGSQIYGVRAEINNAAAGAEKYGVSSQVLNAGVVNYAAYFGASGATTNWAGFFGQGDVFVQDNVGIGTTPSAKLDVAGNTNILSTTAGVDPLVVRSTVDGQSLTVRESDNGFDAVRIFGYDSRGRMIMNNNGTTTIDFDANPGSDSYINAGNFGIGTPSPSAKLDVVNSTISNTTKITNTFTAGTEKLGLYAYTSGGGAGANVGIRGYASGGSGSNYGVQGNAFTTGTTNYGIYGSATGATTNNWAGYFASGDVYIQNNVGIGTSSPTAQLEVNGTQAISYNTQNLSNGSQIDPNITSYVRITGGGGSYMLAANSIINGNAIGQILYLTSAHGGTTTIQNSATVKLNGGGNYSMGAFDSLTLIWNDSVWIELSRSNN